MISRRDFLISTGVAAFATPLQALQARIAAGGSLTAPGYGPIAPVADMATGLKLLELPAGFKYRVVRMDRRSDGHGRTGSSRA